MAKYQEYNQKQNYFIPVNQEINFPDGSFVRFINDFIDKNIHISVLIFPLLWAILSLYPIIMMGIIAVMGFTLIIIRNRKYKQKALIK